MHCGLAGARSRAEARKSGRHRDLGIASKKQQQRHAEQAERQVVRQIIAEQLTESDDELAA
jgi:hypothetical protein